MIRGAVQSVGIDAEPNDALEPGVLEMIASTHEREMLARITNIDTCFDRAMFCMKEAFYKAFFQLEPQFLEFLDAAVTISPSTATFRVSVLRSDVSAKFRGRAFSGRYSVEDGLICTAITIT